MEKTIGTLIGGAAELIIFAALIAIVGWLASLLVKERAA